MELGKANVRNRFTVQIYRLIANYEICEDGVGSEEVYLNHARSCGLPPLIKQFFGRAISRIWGDKIVKSRRLDKEPDFLHLRRRSFLEGVQRPLTILDDETLKRTEQLLTNRCERWAVYGIVGQNVFSVIRVDRHKH